MDGQMWNFTLMLHALASTEALNDKKLGGWTHLFCVNVACSELTLMRIISDDQRALEHLWREGKKSQFIAGRNHKRLDEILKCLWLVKTLDKHQISIFETIFLIISMISAPHSIESFIKLQLLAFFMISTSAWENVVGTFLASLYFWAFNRIKHFVSCLVYLIIIRYSDVIKTL